MGMSVSRTGRRPAPADDGVDLGGPRLAPVDVVDASGHDVSDLCGTDVGALSRAEVAALVGDDGRSPIPASAG